MNKNKQVNILYKYKKYPNFIYKHIHTKLGKKVCIVVRVNHVSMLIKIVDLVILVKISPYCNIKKY